AAAVPYRCRAVRAARAPGGAVRAGWWRPWSGPCLERDGYLVAAMGADPHLPPAEHLSAVFEPHRLVRPADAFPARHALALIAGRRRGIGLHSSRLSPLVAESSRRSTRAGFPPTITPGGMSWKTTAWMPTTVSRPIRTPGRTETCPPIQTLSSMTTGRARPGYRRSTGDSEQGRWSNTSQEPGTQ